MASAKDELKDRGVLNQEYHVKRTNSTSFRYRLNKRVQAVSEMITRHCKDPSGLRCLEIGCADGLLLSMLQDRFEFSSAAGIDLSRELIESCADTRLRLSIARAEQTCFPEGSFDLIIASAVIEHLDSPERMLKECFRVLADRGLVIVNAPSGWHDRIAQLVGYVPRGSHKQLFSLNKLKNLFEENGFTVLEAKRHMLNPFFDFLLQEKIEMVLRKLGLSILISNLIIVGQK